MAVQAALAFALLLTFRPAAIWLGIGSLALVAVYPFAKRFTWWPQVFLGLAFNWGALLCWAGVTGSLTAAPVVLYLSGIAWTLYYDTIYAHQDKDDDELIGVRSTARLFGERTRGWLFGFLAATVLLLGAAVVLALAPGRNALAMALGVGGALGAGLAPDLADAPAAHRRSRQLPGGVPPEPRHRPDRCAVSRRGVAGMIADPVLAA